MNQCVGGIEAVEFFESLSSRITDTERETYERAMTRIRYEVAKGIGAEKRTVKAVKAWHTDFKVCGRCGFGAGEPNFYYCPNCGTRYLTNPETLRKLEAHQVTLDEWLGGIGNGEF